MIAQFNSYRELETPMLYVCNPGCKLENGMLTNVVGILTDVSDIEIVPTFNATSELNFRAYKVKRENADDNLYAMNMFRSLRNRRLIYVDGVGFFVIVNSEDGYAKGQTYKEIKAESAEVELKRKKVPYIENGTYQFCTGDFADPGLLEILIATAPLWTIGHVDSTVASRWRTFEDVDFTKNLNGFLLEDMQDAYECLFVFDIVNRIINVYDQANYVVETDIHLTKDDLISEMKVSESSDDLYTALSVQGENDLSINAVNPLGTSVIYNFSYYLDWMTSGLRTKVAAWQALVASKASDYYDIQVARFANLTTLSSLTAEKERLEMQLTMYNRCKDNLIAAGDNISIDEYNAVIEQYGGTPIPTGTGYTWVMFADASTGSGISANPTDKQYIGLAWDKLSNVPSRTPSDYQWFTFRSGETFGRSVDGTTKYTWVVFADGPTTGMSDLPENKAYMGIAIDQASGTKSASYSDYSWELTESDGIGVDQALSAIIALAQDVEADIATVNASIELTEAAIAAQDESVEEIHEAVAMDTYFTDGEMDELSNYIAEGSYTDEYITVTENMTYSEQFAQMKTLYDRGIGQLERVAFPTQEYTVDAESFIFNKEFQPWAEQLETGCLINVELDDGDVAALFLTSFTVNYEDRTMSLTLGNRYNRFDPRALFDDVLGSVSKSANTLSYIKDQIYPIKSGEWDAMKEAVETSRNLTKNDVLSSDNEQVVIDDTGYTGRRRLADGTIDPKQIKINGRNIVFTDDNWETCKTAIGEVLLGNGASAYGVNCEVLLGNIIIGNALHIVNDNGEDMFQVTANSVIYQVGEDIAVLNQSINDFGSELAMQSTRIEENANGIQQNFSYYSQLDGEVKDITAYVHTGQIGIDSGGNPIYGVKIGKTDGASTFSSMFTPTELGFYDASDKVAYLSNKKLNVNTVRATTMEMTDDLSDAASNKWQISCSGGYTIKWIG